MSINAIPMRVMEAANAVTLKHPNSLDCTIYRKVIKRAADGTMGGLPTLGGLGVLSPDDEDQYTYEEVGEAKLLVTSAFDGELDTTDREDSYVPESALQEAMIVATTFPAFEIKKYDVAAVMPGGGVVLAFEILKLPTTTTLYPYTTKYVITPRDDLHTLIPTA